MYRKNGARFHLSAVNAELKVHGIESLRIADGSIMPRVTTGNTMAPCIIIGEPPLRPCGSSTS
jgi:choline dehydrogenase